VPGVAPEVEPALDAPGGEDIQLIRRGVNEYWGVIYNGLGVSLADF
jgi:hypothetical protein